MSAATTPPPRACRWAAPHAALAAWDGPGIAAQLSRDGYALLPGLFASDAAELLRLANEFDNTAHGDAPLFATGPAGPEHGRALPLRLSAWRDALYPYLVPIANHWMEVLGQADAFPDTLAAFEGQNRAAGQTTPLSHFNRLSTGGDILLRQDTAGPQVFPLQVVGLLSAPDADFTGGALILTEQRPRMQSRPTVVPLRYGDAAIICTGARPVRGSHGVYRVNVRHAVGRVRSGQRIGLSLSFHGAP